MIFKKSLIILKFSKGVDVFGVEIDPQIYKNVKIIATCCEGGGGNVIPNAIQ